MIHSALVRRLLILLPSALLALTTPAHSYQSCDTTNLCGECDHAEFVAQQVTFGPAVGGFIQTLELGAPPLALADKVRRIEITATVSIEDVYVIAENLDSEKPCPCHPFVPGSWTLATTYELISPSNNLFAMDLLAFGEDLPILGVFDGVSILDPPHSPPFDPCTDLECDSCADPCACESGYSFRVPHQSFQQVTACIEDPADISIWMQPVLEGFDSTYFDFANIVAFDLDTGCGLLAHAHQAKISLVLEATYFYCPSPPPVAEGDSAQTCENTPVSVSLLHNDAAAPGRILDCTSITTGAVQPQGAGMVVLTCDTRPACCQSQDRCEGPHPACTLPYDTCTGDHDVLFVPAPGFQGIASFLYSVADDLGCRSNEALVEILVLAAPTATDDLASTCSGDSIFVHVLGNDLPGDRPIVPSTLQIVGSLNPSVGTASVVSGCSAGLGSGYCILFVPADGFEGVAEFQYSVRDDACCLSTATVQVQVLPRPKVPIVQRAICQGDSLELDLLEGRSGGREAGPPKSVSLCNPPASQYGSAWLEGSVLHYLPDPGPCDVTEVLYYRVTDGAGCHSDCTPIEITIHCNPIARPDFVVKQPGSSDPIWIDVLANDDATTFPLDPWAPEKHSDPSHGTAERQPDGRFLYTPNSNFPGTDSFTYRIWDTFGCEALAKVTITEECPTVVNHRRPASLLLYPMFDNRLGTVTVISVTQTGWSGLGQGDIQVHFVYREESDCSPFNRAELLTPKDTLTLITNAHAPDPERGYVYVYARCPLSEQPVVSNTLVGQLLVVDGIESLSFSVNPFGYRGIGDPSQLDSACGLPLTDLDGDGVRDLDNLEYELAPDQILIPRFMGQGGGFHSELILIGLTGRAFSTTIDFLVYNDNEEVFSTEYTFRCWERTPLLSISGIFSNAFLKTTNHARNEIFDGSPDESPWESGWIRLDGGVAVSDLVSISDPAFLAVLIERTPDGRFVADLPWEHCTQFGGALLRSGPLFD